MPIDQVSSEVEEWRSSSKAKAKQKKMTSESVVASNAKDLPKNAILRRTPEGHAYFSPKDASKGMGCGKCRFSKRGCTRCSAAVPGTFRTFRRISTMMMETKDLPTKQPKRSREAASNAELSTPHHPLKNKKKTAKKSARRTTA